MNKNKAALAVTLFIYLNASLAHGDRVATSQGVDDSVTSRLRHRADTDRPALRDLHRCSEGIADSFFDRSGNELIKWQAKKGYSNPTTYPSVAVSAYVDDPARPDFITVTPNKIFVTPAHPHDVRNTLFERTDQKVQLVLNLSGRMDPRRGLPIVDERESISPSWFKEFTLRSEAGGRNVGLTLNGYHASDLKSPYTEVKAEDALTGRQADAAASRLTELLRRRLGGTAAKVEEIFRARQSMRWDHGDFDLYRGTVRLPQHDYLNSADIRTLREGLCSCEGSFVETDEVKKRLTAPESPVRAWDQNGPRKIDPADLSCGMV